MKVNLLKRFTLLVVAVMLFSFSVSTVSFAGDVTSAPSFIPSFPMLAGDNVMIMWIPVPGAVKYKVYLDGKEIGETPAPPFTTPSPTDAGTYKYTLAGVDAAGEEGPQSSAGTLAIVKMVKPTGLMHRFLGEVLNLRWDASSAASIYDVFRSETKDGDDYKLIGSISENKFTDSDVMYNADFYGKTFYYYVIAIDKFNKRSPKSEIHEVAIVKPEEEVAARNMKFNLRIQRTKQTKFLKPMGGGTDVNGPSSPHFLSSGELVFADNKGSITVLDKYGDQARVIGKRGLEESMYQSPISMSISPDGDFYIVDYRTSSLMKFDSGEKWVWTKKTRITKKSDNIGIEGDDKWPNKDYKVSRPRGIEYYDGKLYVSDMETGAVNIYNAEDGEFIDFFKNKETGKVHRIGAITDIMITKDGSKMLVSNPVARLIPVFSPETGEKLFGIGYSTNFVGAFVGITGITETPDGNIAVADSEMSSVQIFSAEDGTYLHHIGDKKAIPDPRSFDQRPFVRAFQKPTVIEYDSEGKLYIFVYSAKGFIVRENIGDAIWDISTDEPEGEVPAGLLEGYELDKKPK